MTNYFGTVRVYSNAKSNRKFKAAADFITGLLENRHYDESQTSRKQILETIQKRMSELDTEFPKVSAKIDVTLTDYGQLADYIIRVMALSNQGYPLELVEVLCYKDRGRVEL